MSASICIPLLIVKDRATGRPSASTAMLPSQRTFQCGLSPWRSLCNATRLAGGLPCLSYRVLRGAGCRTGALLRLQLGAEGTAFRSRVNFRHQLLHLCRLSRRSHAICESPVHIPSANGYDGCSSQPDCDAIGSRNSRCHTVFRCHALTEP